MYLFENLWGWSSFRLFSRGKLRLHIQLTSWLNCSLVVLVIFMCQNENANSQRMDRISCERRPTHTTALKSSGDNGFSIKILGAPPPQYYEPGHDYQVLLNGSYSNQQFLDFMLVATLKQSSNEGQSSAGTFTHMLNHMTKGDDYCSHVMTSVTFHPSYKKSVASFLWTAPNKGSGCVIFKATVVEHPDIWFSDEGGLSKMFCERPDGEPAPSSETTERAEPAPKAEESTSHTKRQSTTCCACDVAKYEVTFNGNWSRETHPKNFPSREYESLLHWSDIIGASHSPSYSIWSYNTLASTGVKEVCEFGWPSTLEGEIKQQSRNVRTVIKAKGIWGYPALYVTKRSARFSTDNSRPLMSLLTMIGPSPDWCVGVDSVNMCLEDCSWRDKLDIELYPWDAGTDSGVTYLSNNLPTYPRAMIQPLTNVYPNNTASPFYGDEKIQPMATLSIRRVGVRNSPEPNQRCEASSSNPSLEGGDLESSGNVKCMTTEWSEFSACSVTCGVGVKSRTRQFKHPMGSVKVCPDLRLQELDNCLGLVNDCDGDPSERVDVCITTAWSNWNPCSVSCGSGSRIRTRQYLHAMGPAKCTQSLSDSDICTAAILDCMKARMMTNWEAVCALPADPSICTGDFTRYFYDVNMGKCRPFQYGGCRGNQNNFYTEEECRTSCSDVMAGEDLSSGVEEADVDCMVTEWSPFSECTVTCGTGLRGRSRQIKRRSSGSGAPCPKDLHDSRVCASECPPQTAVSSDDVDCMMSAWGRWSECTTTCGDGQKLRQRMVKRPPQGRGKPCMDLKEMRRCNLGNCVAPNYSQCMLSEWTTWAECSVACGDGKRMRRRMEKRGPCPDDTIFTLVEPCRGQQCEGVTPVNCAISPWSNWTECDKPCGVMGTQSRARVIIHPALYGGTCEFNNTKEMEMRACYNGACLQATTDIPESDEDGPVDCMVASWSSWNTCSKSCGTGKQVRRRKVKRKRKNGGERCPPLKETQTCTTGSVCRRRRYRHLKTL